MPSPSQLFKHQPQLLSDAFELWKNGKYNHFHKAYFICNESLEPSFKNELLIEATHFKFEPDVVQILGALRASDGKTMRYDEAFLNMLQRLDFQTLKISLDEVTYQKNTWFSIKASALAIEVFRLVLTTWLRDFKVVID